MKRFEVTVVATGMLTRTITVLAADEQAAKATALIIVADRDDWLLQSLDGDSVEVEHIEPVVSEK